MTANLTYQAVLIVWILLTFCILIFQVKSYMVCYCHIIMYIFLNIINNYTMYIFFNTINDYIRTLCSVNMANYNGSHFSLKNAKT